eukprot:961788-Alexandrium_andersonii.AAC.1
MRWPIVGGGFPRCRRWLLEVLVAVLARAVLGVAARGSVVGEGVAAVLGVAVLGVAARARAVLGVAVLGVAARGSVVGEGVA